MESPTVDGKVGFLKAPEGLHNISRGWKSLTESKLRQKISGLVELCQSSSLAPSVLAVRPAPKYKSCLNFRNLRKGFALMRTLFGSVGTRNKPHSDE